MNIQKFAVMKLPDASVAVHVTVVAPSGKNSGASFSIEITPTISDVLTSKALRFTEFENSF